MIIYVVEASSGSYDSFSSWVHSVHTSLEVAEKEKERINSEYEERSKIPPPFPVDEDGDLINENLSEEDKEKYYKWANDIYDTQEWRGAEIKEYETDKAYPQH